MLQEALEEAPASVTLLGSALNLDITLKPAGSPKAGDKCDASPGVAAVAAAEQTLQAMTLKPPASQVRGVAPPVAAAIVSPLLDTDALRTLPSSHSSTRPASAAGSRPPSANAPQPSPDSGAARGYVARAQAYLARWQRDRKQERFRGSTSSSGSLADDARRPRAKCRQPGMDKEDLGPILEIRGVAPMRTPKVPHRPAAAV
eukprot:SRR837773.6203.p1 GENE.SRR837773.6203~~SRR837773.6203.p1  ORF type:complete len:202 (+),score=27.86 SRR837773.6203:806-1411(+)